MTTLNDIFEKFNIIKNQIAYIDTGLGTHQTKITGLSSRIDVFNKVYPNTIVNAQTKKVYTTLKASLGKLNNKLTKSQMGYKNIKESMPHARLITDKINKMTNPGRQTGLSFNIAPVIAVTAASGMVLAAVYGLGELLDPVERNIETQSTLLDQVIAGTITESQYQTQSNDALNTLMAQDYAIQQNVGFNPWIVLITSTLIYGGYKVLENTGMIKDIKKSIKDITKTFEGEK